MDIKIITNNVPRNILYGYELTEKEREEFDYLDKEELEWHSFLRYKGMIYDLDEFFAVSEYQNDPFKEWDGYQSNSYFSGILVKYVPSDCEEIIVGRYMS